MSLPTDGARGAAERGWLWLRGGVPAAGHAQLDADGGGVGGRRALRVPQREPAALLALRGQSGRLQQQRGGLLQPRHCCLLGRGRYR